MGIGVSGIDDSIDHIPIYSSIRSVYAINVEKITSFLLEVRGQIVSSGTVRGQTYDVDLLSLRESSSSSAKLKFKLTKR